VATLFVGVWPPKKAMQVLADYPRPGGTDGWATEQQWLVNVRPLGSCTDAVADDLLDALRFELDGMPKPKASFGAVLAGSWLRVAIDGLDELRDVVFEATMPIVPVTHPKSLPWEVAIPLRRDRSPKDLVAPLPATTWTVSELVLAAGRRRATGHGYETVASIPLGR
jgi:hypothetical protein